MDTSEFNISPLKVHKYEITELFDESNQTYTVQGVSYANGIAHLYDDPFFGKNTSIDYFRMQYKFMNTIQKLTKEEQKYDFVVLLYPE